MVAVGYGALHSNINQSYQTAIGYKALYFYNQTHPTYAATNTAVGFKALYNSQAYGGTCVGFWAARENTTGCGSTAMGEEALRENTTGNFNVAIGDGALHFNQTGGYNTVVGVDAGSNNNNDAMNRNFNNNCIFGADAGFNLKTGSDNVMMGYQSCYNNLFSSENTAVGFRSLYSQSYPNGNVTWNSYNTAIGDSALFSNQPISTITGIDNTALGHTSLYANTTGIDNTGSGYQAGYSNQTGNYNTISGYQAGYGGTASSNDYYGYWAGHASSSASFNVCLGMEAGQNNTANWETFIGHAAGQLNTGEYNTFVGYSSGALNTTGDSCTFVGLNAGNKNTTANDNSALGNHALFNGTTGFSNTAIGSDAGYFITTGDSNVFVGTNAGVASGNGAFNNCAAYGYGATTTASDKYYFGNANVTWIGGPVQWMVASDGRFKINVKNENIGLDFINKLRPVTYNMDTKALDAFINPNRSQQQSDSTGIAPNSPQADFSKSTSIVHSGFIAQEVDSVSKACGFTSSIVHEPANSGDTYALSYAEFVVPLVRAVQQLDSMNNGLAAKMQTQDSIISVLQNQISQCCASGGSSLRKSDINNNSNVPQQETVQQLELASLSNSVILYQNEPNPFGESTVIRYFVPENIQNVVVVFYDEFGREINRAQVQQNGYGSLQISSANLANGIYSYSIMANGQVVDTKRMLRAK